MVVFIIWSVHGRDVKLGKIQGGGGVAEVTKIDATTWVYFKKVHFKACLRKAIKKGQFLCKAI